jgi:enediyne biosynthesis protein E4
MKASGMNRFVVGITSLAFLAIGLLGLSCQRSPSPSSGTPPPAAWFADVTEEVGLHFIHDPGPVGAYFMPQQVGSGAALFDFNNDGRLDILLLQNGGPNGAKNCLYEQTPDGHFKDVSAGSGLDFAGYNMGVAVGDVNNDGWLDVLITQYNGVKLFLNNGDGTFTNVTEESGLSNPSWATSAAFFDYDRDGRLDLVVVNYVDYDPTWPCTGGDGSPDYCAPKTFHGRVSRLFHNVTPPRTSGNEANAKTPRVRFEDATESSGFGRLPGPGLGVVCADFNGDGWPDVFIANDGAPNRLWINQKDGTFTDEAIKRGVAYNGMAQAQAGMGVALGDVDNDGLFDLFVTHLTEETPTLWKQGPRGLFHDETAVAGLVASSRRGTGFGTLLADFDNDGALDLAVVNGRVSARALPEDWSLGPFWSKYGDRNQLFAGDGHGRFRDISAQNDSFSGCFNVARGLVGGDVFGDGAQDLLVTTVNGSARLFRNVAPKRGHWLSVRAYDPALKRDALGAEVRVTAGGKTRTVWLHPAESYLCSSEPRAHFGLGLSEEVESIEILWPDGTRETFPGGQADRCVELRKGEGYPALK